MKDLLEKLEAAAKVSTESKYGMHHPDWPYVDNPATILQLVASYKATSQALRRAVEALEDIAKYDCPSEGGKYTKVWMTLGKKAKDALASIQQLRLGEGGTE